MISRNMLRQSRRVCDHVFTALPRSSRSAHSLASPFAAQYSPISTRLPAPSRARVMARWYASSSSEGKEGEAAAGEAKDGAKDSEAKVSEEDPSKKELEAKGREIIELKDKYLRSVADFRNLQERSRREQQAAKDFAIQKFARDLIESVDNLDLALTNVAAEKLEAPAAGAEDSNKDLRELHSGLQMTSTVMLNTLAKHGLERFDPAASGDKFDPNLHEATFQAPQPDKEDGTVFHTVQKGFTLNGRVIRAPKVGVVKNS